MTEYIVIGKLINSRNAPSEVVAVYVDRRNAVEYAREMMRIGILSHVYVCARRESDRVDVS